jgi:hypothetical protein
MTAASTQGPTLGVDDWNTASTIAIQFFTACPWLVANGNPNNFVFAGSGSGAYGTLNIAGGLSNIASSDFNISVYRPWVVTNTGDGTGGTNGLVGPDGRTRNRSAITAGSWDWGGNDIVINYTPGGSDPTTINFAQAYIETFGRLPDDDNAGLPANTDNTTGTIDAVTAPYYNSCDAGGCGASGTGTTRITANGALTTNSTTPAWLVDIPGTCENAVNGLCLGSNDGAVTSASVTFQTFIESDTACDNVNLMCNGQAVGTVYKVLYGGVQWGYTYNTTDVPEPLSMLLFGVGAIALGAKSYRRRKL